MSCNQFWRQRIRADVVGRLTNATPAGARVFPDRELPWNPLDPDDSATYPALAVYVGLGRFNESRGGFVGEATIMVDAYAQGVDEAASMAALDALLASVYRVLFVQDFERITIKSLEDDDPWCLNGALMLAGGRLTLTAELGLCIEPEAGDIDPFETVSFQHQLEGTGVTFSHTAEPEQPVPEPEPEPEP